MFAWLLVLQKERSLCHFHQDGTGSEEIYSQGQSPRKAELKGGYGHKK
jgi:hypothetical protein